MGHRDQGIASGTQRYQVVPRTLCFVLRGEEVLLLKGAPHKRLWANRYNGVGGHVEPHEDVYASAMREICEETGWEAADVQGLSLKGLVHVSAGAPDKGVMLFIFTARALRRDTSASTEGALEWVPVSRVSDYDLVEDLYILLPRVLSMPDQAPPLFAHYGYDQQDELVIRFHHGHLPDLS
jgi:8-oxo-dGTP diphosphatase